MLLQTIGLAALVAFGTGLFEEYFLPQEKGFMTAAGLGFGAALAALRNIRFNKPFIPSNSRLLPNIKVIVAWSVAVYGISAVTLSTLSLIICKTAPSCGDSDLSLAFALAAIYLSLVLALIFGPEIAMRKRARTLTMTESSPNVSLQRTH